MKKNKNKLGVSLMISYVLLVFITISLSIGVYIWLKDYATISERINCKDGTSINIETYNIEQIGANKTLNISVKNNGLFNVSGFLISGGNDSKRTPTQLLWARNQIQIYPGEFDFMPELGPGQKQNALFNLSELNKLEVIQIQPYIYKENKIDKIFCEQELVKQVISINPSSIPGLVSWWKLDGNVLDYGAGGNDGTNNGATWQTSGCQLGSCLSFNGNGNYVGVEDDPSLDVGTELTVSAWVKYKKQSETGDHGIIWSSDSFVYSLRRTADVYRFIIYDTGSNWKIVDTIGLTFDKDVWYHLVATYRNGDKIKIYVDGDLNNELPISTISLNNPTYLLLGKTNGGEWFNGTIDEVAIYNKALSDWEILQLYNSYNIAS